MALIIMTVMQTDNTKILCSHFLMVGINNNCILNNMHSVVQNINHHRGTLHT